MAFELLAFIGIFALAIGLIGCFVQATDNAKRKVRAEYEAGRREPWEADRSTHRYR